MSADLARLHPDSLLAFRPRTEAEAATALARLQHTAAAIPAPAATPRRTRATAATTAGPVYRWREEGPPMRDGHRLLADTRRRRWVALGGRSTAWPLVVPVHARAMDDSHPWRALPPYPGPRFLDAVVDSAGDRLLAIGTTGGPYADHDLELWSLALAPGAGWERQSVTTVPAVSGATLAVDRTRGRLMMWGPRDPMSGRRDLWSAPLSGLASGWTVQVRSGLEPAAAFTADLVHEPLRDHFWLLTRGSPYPLAVFRVAADADSAWTPIQVYTGFYQCGSPESMAHDAARDRLLFTDGDGEVLDLDLATGVVTRPGIVPCRPAPGRRGYALGFDARARRLVQDGGRGGFEHPYLTQREFDVDTGTVWRLRPLVEPGSRYGCSFDFDPARRRFIVTGGGFFDAPAITRPVDGEADWQLLSAQGPQPGEATLFAMTTLDPVHDRLVRFGGQRLGTGEVVDRVWTRALASGEDWIEHPQAVGPGARRFASLVHDPVHDRLVLLGGDDGVQRLDDAWELRLTPTPQWRPLVRSGEPAPSYAVRAGDGAGGGVVLATGRAWRLRFAPDTVRVEGLDLPEFPAPGYWLGIVDDAMHAWFAEYQSSRPRFDMTRLWRIRLEPGAQWQAVTLDPGTAPYFRMGMQFVQDPATRILWGIGGYDDGDGYLGDLWLLEALQPVAVRIALAEARSDGTGIALAWESGGAEDARAVVEHSSDAVAWTERAEADAAGRGRWSHTGAALASGARAAFRLRLERDGERLWSEPVWLEGPARARLALAAVRNPVTGPLELHCALPDGGSARLRLMDVHGRVRLAATLAPGTTRWRAGAALPPGLYLVELAQGDARTTVKLTATR